MKKTRKLLSIILCLALTLCLALPALAEENKYTLTIKSETPNHDYEAYQIFAGELSQSPTNPAVSTLVGINWGSGVDITGDALITEIRGISVGDSATQPFANCETADDVATELAKNNSSELADAFAAVVAKHLSSKKYVASTGDKGADELYTAEITELPAGYYLVKEADFIENEGDNNAYTKFILEIVKDVEVEAKADVPTLEKKVSNTADGTYGDAAAASVGSKVYFKITSKVPDMDGYNKYYFIVNDTLSEGLTFNNDLTIKIGTDTVLSNSSDYTVTQTQDPESPTPGTGSKTKLEIIFKDFITKKNLAGQAITITYSAKVNEHAEIGTTGNLNTANLVYSNNPNVEYKGDNKPNPGEPTGETPDDITAVYVTAIQIQKVDTSNYPLTGAGFTLSGTGVITTGVTTIGGFVPDNDNGTYYKLKNGAYTTTPPVPGETDSLYDSTVQKYSPSPASTTWTENESNVTGEGMVGEDGVLKFEGLGAGTYIIAETTVPANYNKIDDITVVITCIPQQTITTGNETCTWTATYQIGTTGSPVPVTVQDGIILLPIQNRSGAELPSTGGIGTTIFVYGGIILMVLALGVVAVRTYSRKKNA